MIMNSNSPKKHAPTDRSSKCNQEKDSLKEILDAFSKHELSVKERPIQQVKPQKGRTLTMSPTQTISWIRMSVDPIISSSSPTKFSSKTQIPKKDSKGLTLPVNECVSTRSSLEMSRNVTETEARPINQFSRHLSVSDSPAFKPNFCRKGSNLLGSNLKVNSVHARSPSSPNIMGQIQSIPKSVGTTDSLTNMVPNSPNSYNGSRYNDSQLEKNFVHSPSIKLEKVDQVENSLINMSQSAKSLGRTKSIQLKIDSPCQDSINVDYLAKILQRRGGSCVGIQPLNDGGSNIESPKSDDLTEKNKYRLTKRGSFSVFKKVVETELVKNA